MTMMKEYNDQIFELKEQISRYQDKIIGLQEIINEKDNEISINISNQQQSIELLHQTQQEYSQLEGVYQELKTKYMEIQRNEMGQTKDMNGKYSSDIQNGLVESQLMSNSFIHKSNISI